jgi:electron transfer flavoprotein alpha subunit
MKIWVVSEIPALAMELAGGAKTISADADVTAFVGGGEAAARSVAAGKAYSAPIPADGMWEDYAPVIAGKAKADVPDLILVGATKRGRETAARIAAILDAPCVSDCQKIAVEGAVKKVERMIYGGMAVKTMTTDAATVVASVPAKSFEAPADGAAASVEMITPAAATAKVTGREPKAAGGVNLGDATKVVGVGRGFAEESELSVAQELARALEAEMACSRPIAEFFKWMPEEQYLGISGQIIKPQVYFACGISGQAQHISGIRDSKIIVAVNKDENAPMMAMSDYFIVGDVKDVLPALAAAVKAQ